MSGLLVRVSKYTATEKVEPIENFLTEAWAWLLGHNQDLARSYLLWIFAEEKIDLIDEDIKWKTQHSLQRNGIIDLVGFTDDKIFGFEHKVDSGLGIEQLTKYKNGLTKRKHSLFLATLTKHRIPVDTYPEGVKPRGKTWCDLYTWLTQYLHKTSNEKDSKDHVLHFLINDFKNLLKEKGMSPMVPIENEVIRSYYKVPELEAQIKNLFKDIHETYDWNNIMKSIPRLRKDKSHEPRSVRRRWGRLGLEFGDNQDWLPGLSFSVILDCEDHAVKPSSVDAGPDLCLIFSFNWSFRKQYPNLENYKKLKNELKEFSKHVEWDFYDHIEDKKDEANFWHQLYLRKPFVEIIKNCRTNEEQKLILIAAMESLMIPILNLDRKNSVPSFFLVRSEIAKMGGNK